MKSKVERIQVVHEHSVSFERALDEAYEEAIKVFKIGDDGNTTIKELKRYNDPGAFMAVRFVTVTTLGSMEGEHTVWEFDAWLERMDESEEKPV